MRSSYDPAEVELLLKDITGLVEPLPARVREEKIQSGTHYCEMLPLEYKPSPRYMEAYYRALDSYAQATADAVALLAERLYQRKGPKLVLVSLARAGIPIGILLRRYLLATHQVAVKHYAISIIRGRGIDRNAMDHILAHHAPDNLQFVDGWTGKGAILGQLREALADYPAVDASLGVLADPANLTALCGTHEDILIPSSCLNATVTGLLSRTFLRGDLIGPQDFHGAAYYGELAEEDLSQQFLDRISACFAPSLQAGDATPTGPKGTQVVEAVAACYGIGDINLIKPGIGEATRVLLRRLPWKIIVNPAFDGGDALGHLRQLAAEKQVPWEPSPVPLGNYKVCGLIKTLSDL